ncbi:hypothetical protein GDO81_006414 [Engystomops pustulosus]|uniref:Uncharacterized protein n=1 Tax=Engystomops pustulosus TaxID=76066 RepID=A0AAV7CWH1_ENGPU|nr:hypothetical protein GDO81_006414 [Engystomops pustulosus]KAG8589496.1 hypothetical protein GDO81_006414 [Engystomops pustulosus]
MEEAPCVEQDGGERTRWAWTSRPYARGERSLLGQLRPSPGLDCSCLYPEDADHEVQ